jgi:hypothetical protein
MAETLDPAEAVPASEIAPRGQFVSNRFKWISNMLKLVKCIENNLHVQKLQILYQWNPKKCVEPDYVKILYGYCMKF